MSNKIPNVNIWPQFVEGAIQVSSGGFPIGTAAILNFIGAVVAVDGLNPAQINVTIPVGIPSPWIDVSTVVQLVTPTNTVVIGDTVMATTEKLRVVGDQRNDIAEGFSLGTNTAGILVSLAESAGLVLSVQANQGLIQATNDAGTTAANLRMQTGGGGVEIGGGVLRVSAPATDTYFEATDGQTAAVSNADEGRLRYNAALQQWELSENGGAYSAISESVGANPTASVGLSTVNGSAATFMRSDAGPPLDQGIAPTWTGAHVFSLASGTAIDVQTADVHIGGKLTVDGIIDPYAVRLSSGGTNVYLEATDGQTAAVSTASEGRLRYSALSQQWQTSANGGAYVPVGTASAAGAVNEVQLSDGAGGLITGSPALTWNGTQFAMPASAQIAFNGGATITDTGGGTVTVSASGSGEVDLISGGGTGLGIASGQVNIVSSGLNFTANNFGIQWPGSVLIYTNGSDDLYVQKGGTGFNLNSSSMNMTNTPIVMSNGWGIYYGDGTRWVYDGSKVEFTNASSGMALNMWGSGGASFDNGQLGLGTSAPSGSNGQLEIASGYANAIYIFAGSAGSVAWSDGPFMNSDNSGNFLVKTGGGNLSVSTGGGSTTFSDDVTINGKLTVIGIIDPPAMRLSSGGTNVYYESTDGQTAAVSNANEGRIRYNAGSQAWEQSANGGAYAAIGAIVSDDPTAQVGLAVVNGSATTFMRSDAAPSLNVGISPTWEGTHTFNNTIVGNIDSANALKSATTTVNTSSATAPTSGQVLTATSGTAATWQTPAAAPVGANPSASVGLSAVNGSATTFLRSDGAPALNVGISPTWSGTHTFNNTIVGNINSSNAIKSATTTVNTSSATAPTVGQVLTATGASAATWQTPAALTIPVTKSANYTITSADFTAGQVFLLDTSGGAFTLTLPAPGSVAGFVVLKDKTGNFSANNLTLARSGSEKIEQIASSAIFQTNFGYWTIRTNQTDWWIF